MRDRGLVRGLLGVGGWGRGRGLGRGGGLGEGVWGGGGGKGHFIHLAMYCTTTWCFALKGLRTIIVGISHKFVAVSLLRLC